MKLLARLRHPVIREWLVILLALWALSFFAIREQWLWRVDQTLYDDALGLLARPAQPDIVIVGIDDASLQQVGRWPWNRAVHAALLDKLTAANARVVVLDVVLTEPDRQNPRGDEVLAAALKNNGRAVIPIIMTGQADQIVGESRPAPLFEAGAARLSQISSSVDPDGILRAVYLRGGLGAAKYDFSALAALRIADPQRWPAARSLPGVADPRGGRVSSGWLRDYWYHIPFAGPPAHFRQVSYVSVLSGAVPPDFFRDKIVLVGATAASMGDEQPTPVSGETRSMAGIEIQANIIQGLREGLDIRLAGAPAAIATTWLLLLGLMLAYLWLTPRWSLALTIALALAALAGAAALFAGTAIWWSPVVAFLGLMLAYPLWSWRKLEATQRFFDAELARLEREPSIVPLEAAQAISPRAPARVFVPDVIENRIAALQATAQRLRTLNRFVADSLESLPEAALVTDAQGRILLANSSADRLFKARRTTANLARGRTPDRPLEARDILELLAQFRQNTGKSWRDVWIDAYEETATVALEVQNQTGQELLMQIAPLFSARGPQIGTIVTLTDVSPLRESERRRDEALRFLSHDMRSPQASILTLLDMHADDPQSIPVDKLTARIEKYARRTLNLADDFLRLARAEKARSEDFEPLDLAELMQDAAEEAWSMASAKGIRIDHRLIGAEAWVNGDRDLLTRALINLLSNAIKYSPADTVVTLECQPCDADWEIAVADQGYGIAPEDMSRLFNRFVRLKHEGQPEEDGIGLGLVFVKTVVERHGGQIHVTSKVAADENGGRGTRFALLLPAASVTEDGA